MVVRGADIKEALSAFLPNTSVLPLLLNKLQENANKTAQVEAWSGKTASFSDMLQLSSSMAAELCSKGITAGDLIVLCCDKSIVAYSLLLGTMFTGATTIVIDPQVAGEIDFLLEDNPVKAVFCNGTVLDLIKQSLKEKSPKPILVAAVDREDETMKSLMSSKRELNLFYVKDVQSHIPLVIFTSGSTNKPKGVQVTDLALQQFGYSLPDELMTIALLTSKLNWIGSFIFFISSVFRGFTLLLNNDFEPTASLELIHKYKVDTWLVLATNLNYYSEHPSLSQLDLKSLSTVVIGGGVLMRRAAERFIGKVLNGRTGLYKLYGSTETGALTCWKKSDLLDWTKADSTGYMAPGVEIKILDDEGKEVTSGNLGEIWTKSYSLMLGYWNRPELNKQLFDEEGFFNTGDAGYFDADGFLYVTGRFNSLAVCQGTKVPLSDVEDVLRSHPDVLEVVVMAKPDCNNLHLAAFVVLKLESEVTEEEIITFVEDQVGNAKKLGLVKFLDKLPKTVNDKIKLSVLQEMLF